MPLASPFFVGKVFFRGFFFNKDLHPELLCHYNTNHNVIIQNFFFSLFFVVSRFHPVDDFVFIGWFVVMKSFLPLRNNFISSYRAG